jgi:adenosylhomocysteine nucleosidase
MICYAFPLAHEAEPLMKRCTQKERFTIGGLSCTLANFRGRPILIALVGMGMTRAEANTEVIFQYFRPKGFVLAGYGGALIPQLKLGQVVISSNFSSPEVLSFLRLLSGFDFTSFCTADELVSTPERRDWYAQNHQLQVIDMESAAVAEVVFKRSVPLIVVRAISDEYQQTLPTGALAAGFDAVKGRATPLRLLSYLATHPAEFAPFKKFVAGLSIARNNLTKFLEDLNDELPSNW